MKSIFLVVAAVLASLVSTQTVSPCLTECLIFFCPKGISDTACFCTTQVANVTACLESTCHQGPLEQSAMLFNQYCENLPTPVVPSLLFLLLTVSSWFGRVGGFNPLANFTADATTSASASATASKSPCFQRIGVDLRFRFGECIAYCADERIFIDES